MKMEKENSYTKARRGKDVRGFSLKGTAQMLQGIANARTKQGGLWMQIEGCTMKVGLGKNYGRQEKMLRPGKRVDQPDLSECKNMMELDKSVGKQEVFFLLFCLHRALDRKFSLRPRRRPPVCRDLRYHAGGVSKHAVQVPCSYLHALQVCLSMLIAVTSIFLSPKKEGICLSTCC